MESLENMHVQLFFRRQTKFVLKQLVLNQCFLTHSSSLVNGLKVKGKKKNRQKQQHINQEKSLNLESVEHVYGKLNKALDEFKSSQFCFDVLHSIDICVKSTNFNSIKEIYCYGLGKFSESKSSLHQLAALIIFQRQYSADVKVYDPIFTSVEIKVLEKLKFDVLFENEEGKRRILDNQITLVYLPHCPKQLTNNFLWANWNTSLKNCILIANSFSRIIEDSTEKVLKESAHYILKIYSKTEEIVLQNKYHFEDIFNDISIHCFNSSNLDKKFFQQTFGGEPIYFEDIELITNSIKDLNIKNE